MDPELERRAFAVEGLSIERRDAAPPIIRGHAAVFNALSEDLGGFREQIMPGAFADAIVKDDVRALFNHDANFILGRNVSGTLKMVEDARGLAIEITPPDTGIVRDLVLAPIERGDVTGMSFGFSVRPGGQDWAVDDNGFTVRTLKNVRLYDVSPVVYPAYRQTDVALRSLSAFKAAAPARPFVNLARARERLAQV